MRKREVRKEGHREVEKLGSREEEVGREVGREGEREGRKIDNTGHLIYSRSY